MNKKALGIVVVLVLVAAIAIIYFMVLPKGEAVVHYSAYEPGEPFITNVRDSNALVKATVVLEVNRALDDEAFQEYMAENNHVIRDTIVFILRDKTEQELKSPDIKAILTDEIVNKVNQALNIDNVTGISLTDYVVQ